MDHLECRLLSRGYDTEQTGSTSLEEVIHELCRKSSGEAALLEIHRNLRQSWLWRSQYRGGIFAVWTLPVTAPTPSSLSDVLDEFEESLNRNGDDFVGLCSIHNAETAKPKSFLICIKYAEAAHSSLFSSSYTDSEKVTQPRLLRPRPRRASQRSFLQRNVFGTCSLSSVLLVIQIILVAAMIAVTVSFMSMPIRKFDPLCPRITTLRRKAGAPKQEEIYLDTTSPMTTSAHPAAATVVSTSNTGSTSVVKVSAPGINSDDLDIDGEWNIPAGNTGPIHQKYLLPSNVSTFTASHDVSKDFILRLDDQALMPAGLVDAHELNVQTWFATNFPLLASVRDGGLHLSSSFLDFNGTENKGPERLLLDERYHIAHCTTAFRRYLRALKNGKHVCPKDLDLNHLDHCTKQLESFAYRPRESWGSLMGGEQLGDRFMEPDEEFDPMTSQVMLYWHTDVCY